MFGLLDDIVEIIENIPDYVLWALEMSFNGYMELIQLALEAANAVLGELPAVITPPAYLGEINWYYPVGTLLSVATPLITFYVTWLGISWVYRKFGAL